MSTSYTDFSSFLIDPGNVVANANTDLVAAGLASFARDTAVLGRAVTAKLMACAWIAVVGRRDFAVEATVSGRSHSDTLAPSRPFREALAMPSGSPHRPGSVGHLARRTGGDDCSGRCHSHFTDRAVAPSSRAFRRRKIWVSWQPDHAGRLRMGSARLVSA